MKAAWVRPIVYSITIGVSANLAADSVCERDRGEVVLATAKHLKSGLYLDDLRQVESAYEGIEMYKPRRNFDKFGAHGMSIARVATTEIRCNHKELVSLWLNQSARTSWDTACKAVYPIKSNKDDGVVNTQLSHFVEKSPTGLDPSRDYVIEVLQPYPASLVDQTTINSLVFVNIDASEEIPRSWFFVRGRQNSILLLEPRGEHCTKVTLVIEKDLSGWYIFSAFLASLLSGDSPVLLLRDLKRALEEKEEEDMDGLLSVEEIAERKFRKSLEQPLGESIVDSKVALREELQTTVKLLEERLARVTKAEKVEKIDLSDLKARVKEDLRKAKKNLSQH